VLGQARSTSGGTYPAVLSHRPPSVPQTLSTPPGSASLVDSRAASYFTPDSGPIFFGRAGFAYRFSSSLAIVLAATLTNRMPFARAVG